jgi:hypothetical protein
LPARSNHVDTLLQSRGNTYGINDDVGSKSVAEPFHHLDWVLAGSIQCPVGAELTDGNVQPWGILFNPGDENRPGSLKPGHLKTQKPDRSRSENDNEIAWTDVGIDGRAMVSHAARLQQRGPAEGKPVRQMVQATNRNPGEMRHRAVRVVTESLSVRTQVIYAGTAKHADSADFGGGFAGDSISLLKSTDPASGASDDAGKLMTQDHGNSWFVPQRVAPHVDIASAYGNGTNREEDLILADLRHRYLPDLDRLVFVFVMNDCGHGLGHRLTLLDAANNLSQNRNQIGFGRSE